MNKLYQFIADQRGTATALQCASHLHMGVNAVIADLKHLESIGCIKRDGLKTDRARWTAIREPNRPPMMADASRLPLVRL